MLQKCDSPVGTQRAGLGSVFVRFEVRATPPLTRWIPGDRVDQNYLTQHTSSQFNQELESVRNNVLAMGGLVEKQLSEALQALFEGDSQRADVVVNTDWKVDSMEVAIDEQCGEIFARRQPAAGDLRTMMMVIKTITDLERIGDEEENIARLAIDLAGTLQPKAWLTDLRRLGEHVKRMLSESLNAYARMEVPAAAEVIREDFDIDEEYELTMRHLMTFMLEDPRQTTHVLDLLWCARALERIGDHAKNVSEYVVYMVHGKDVRHVSIEEMEKQVHTEF